MLQDLVAFYSIKTENGHIVLLEGLPCNNQWLEANYSLASAYNL